MALPDPPDSPPEPAADPEEAALRELGRRVVRLRGLIAGICTLLGVAVGIAGYLLLRDWQLQHNGAHVPLFTAGISYGPSLGLSLLIARTLGEVLVRLRADGWIAELAAKHGVAGERLREYSLVWSRSGR